MRQTECLPPCDPITDPQIRQSYDVSKLYYMKTNINSEEEVRNKTTVRQFCRAYQDSDWEDVLKAMDQESHVGTLWGVVRGELSIIAALKEEQKQRIVFITTLKTVTSNTFDREGYIQRTDTSWGPIGRLYHSIKRLKVKESFVVSSETGKIVFRQLHLKGGYFQGY